MTTVDIRMDLPSNLHSYQKNDNTTTSIKKKKSLLSLLKWPKKKKKDWKQGSLQDMSTVSSDEPDWLPGGLKVCDISAVRRRQLANQEAAGSRPVSMIEGGSGVLGSEFGRKRQAPHPPPENSTGSEEHSFSHQTDSLSSRNNLQVSSGPIPHLSSFGKGQQKIGMASKGLGGTRWLSQSVPCLVDDSEDVIAVDIDQFGLSGIDEEDLAGHTSEGIVPTMITFTKSESNQNSNLRKQNPEIIRPPPSLRKLLPEPPREPPPPNLRRHNSAITSSEKAVGTDDHETQVAPLSREAPPVFFYQSSLYNIPSQFTCATDNESLTCSSSTSFQEPGQIIIRPPQGGERRRSSSKRDSDDYTADDLGLMFDEVIAVGERTLDDNKFKRASPVPSQVQKENLPVTEEIMFNGQKHTLINLKTPVPTLQSQQKEQILYPEVRTRRPRQDQFNSIPLATIVPVVSASPKIQTERPRSTIIIERPLPQLTVNQEDESSSDASDVETESPETIRRRRERGHTNSLLLEGSEFFRRRSEGSPSIQKDISLQRLQQDLTECQRRVKKSSDQLLDHQKGSASVSSDIQSLQKQLREQQVFMETLKRNIEALTVSSSFRNDTNQNLGESFESSTSYTGSISSSQHLERIYEDPPTTEPSACGPEKKGDGVYSFSSTGGSYSNSYVSPSHKPPQNEPSQTRIIESRSTKSPSAALNSSKAEVVRAVPKTAPKPSQPISPRRFSANEEIHPPFRSGANQSPRIITVRAKK